MKREARLAAGATVGQIFQTNLDYPWIVKLVTASQLLSVERHNIFWLVLSLAHRSEFAIIGARFHMRIEALALPSIGRVASLANGSPRLLQRIVQCAQPAVLRDGTDRRNMAAEVFKRGDLVQLQPGDQFSRRFLSKDHKRDRPLAVRTLPEIAENAALDRFERIACVLQLEGELQAQKQWLLRAIGHDAVTALPSLTR